MCPADQWLVNLEEGVDQEVANELRRRGHKVNWPITGTLLILHNYCLLWLQDIFLQDKYAVYAANTKTICTHSFIH